MPLRRDQAMATAGRVRRWRQVAAAGRPSPAAAGVQGHGGEEAFPVAGAEGAGRKGAGRRRAGALPGRQGAGGAGPFRPPPARRWRGGRRPARARHRRRAGGAETVGHHKSGATDERGLPWPPWSRGQREGAFPGGRRRAAVRKPSSAGAGPRGVEAIGLQECAGRELHVIFMIKNSFDCCETLDLFMYNL